jgi:hypothetical protein
VNMGIFGVKRGLPNSFLSPCTYSTYIVLSDVRLVTTTLLTRAPVARPNRATLSPSLALRSASVTASSRRGLLYELVEP